MRNREERSLYLYPQYFASVLTRRLGRRVSKRYSISNPSREKLEETLKKLGMQYSFEEAISYPRESNKPAFRLKVFTQETKNSLIKKIAVKINE